MSQMTSATLRLVRLAKENGKSFLGGGGINTDFTLIRNAPQTDVQLCTKVFELNSRNEHC